MRVRSFSKVLVIFIALCVTAAMLLCDVQKADAAVFSEKKPEGLVATATGGRIAVSWEKVKGTSNYRVYQAIGKDKADLKFKRVATTKHCKIIKWKNLVKGAEYNFYVVAAKKVKNEKKTTYIYSKRSDIRTTTMPTKGKSTLKNFLRVGISPIGSTMYIWGGGWNGVNKNGQSEYFKTGLSSKWRSFSKKHYRNYSYLRYLFQREKGLDCSGFVGNCVYNIMETENGQNGYVDFARNEGKLYAKMGFGKYSSRRCIKKRRAGDIMTCLTHVWICLGECEDGSAVVLHSSPPAVFIAGTPSKTGVSNSQAVKLARKYMKKYYPKLYSNYKDQVYRGSVYNTAYGRMRWNKKTLSDPEGYRKMNASQVLHDLFSERELPGRHAN